MSTDSAHLENVMFRLMEYQSGEKINHTDTMIMISLVNLLGIISVLNKQPSSGARAPRSMAEHPLIAALLGTLGQGQNQQAARGGGLPV